MRSKRIGVAAAMVLTLAGGIGFGSQAQTPGSGGVFVLTIDDAIGPATSHYISQGLDEAAAADASLVVLAMDTPGGLETSMQEIIQAILVSPVPVATYVSPEGAWAASAGTYILYASHVAAMAPATNVGAATPVAIGGGPAPAAPDDDAPLDDILDRFRSDDGASDEETADEPPAPAPTTAPRADIPEPATASERKAINNAVSYIRSLAERRGRNADWAESAVRNADSLSANAALAAGVIDLIADDLDDLLRQLDGRIVDGIQIALSDPPIVTQIEPDWRTRLLAVISNPTLAYMLMLLGIYGLIFEGYNPGAIVPGVVGAISLLLALFAFQVLPVNYAGLALILLGLILITAEFFVPSFGALGIGGIAAFVFGSLIFIDTDVPGFEVATSLIAGIAFSGALALAGTISLAMRSRQHKVVSGVEELHGMLAEALEDFEDKGPVWVHGERWTARSPRAVSKGQRLRVKQVTGLVLQVEPATDPSQQS
jgi:membrane-bound serine protease (ClpP class)